MTTIAVFVGSLRRDSFNKALARNIERLLPEGVEFRYADLDLPLYDQDLDANLPEKVVALKKLVAESDGVLFVTPEYNRSFSGVIKNAIDWASRPWGQSSFAGKPAAIAGASIGALGTTQAQSQLRNVLLFLDMKVMGQPELYFNASAGLDGNGDVAPESKDFLQGFVDALVAHVRGEK
ncbi:NAD(P)H-dependent oxidoreductase [uncultured Bifidobacterium sp.]|uniref:NADPH-dependent FMN reductase n=1 Tax=uncultured Bifidobacterium sp. TaxID=165187 RepID=UPI0028DCD77B|nr:NAD(P)H-dependent oxidoreductase [uncultured Bifidobacterium sp.]